MNQIFRVIWNHSTQTWMAVSELAKGKVKSSSSDKTNIEINRSHQQWWGASSILLVLSLSSQSALSATALEVQFIREGCLHLLITIRQVVKLFRQELLKMD